MGVNSLRYEVTLHIVEINGYTSYCHVCPEVLSAAPQFNVIRRINSGCAISADPVWDQKLGQMLKRWMPRQRSVPGFAGNPPWDYAAHSQCRVSGGAGSDRQM
jgi:hypothetical protein